MYCIVLIKYISSIVFSSVDDFNLKFKKQSKKLKHYEGETILQELETETRDERR